jgi:predicted N-acetyltransferase YhbS
MRGLWGLTSFSYLWVDLLSVPESMRGVGIGRKLMMLAEAEAVQRGCRAVALDTFSFQARGFYERLGCSGCRLGRACEHLASTAIVDSLARLTEI